MADICDVAAATLYGVQMANASSGGLMGAGSASSPALYAGPSGLGPRPTSDPGWATFATTPLYSGSGAAVQHLSPFSGQQLPPASLASQGLSRADAFDSGRPVGYGSGTGSTTDISSSLAPWPSHLPPYLATPTLPGNGGVRTAGSSKMGLHPLQQRPAFSAGGGGHQALVLPSMLRDLMVHSASSLAEADSSDTAAIIRARRAMLGHFGNDPVIGADRRADAVGGGTPLNQLNVSSGGLAASGAGFASSFAMDSELPVGGSNGGGGGLAANHGLMRAPHSDVFIDISTLAVDSSNFGSIGSTLSDSVTNDRSGSANSSAQAWASGNYTGLNAPSNGVRAAAPVITQTYSPSADMDSGEARSSGPRVATKPPSQGRRSRRPTLFCDFPGCVRQIKGGVSKLMRHKRTHTGQNFSCLVAGCHLQFTSHQAWLEHQQHADHNGGHSDRGASDTAGPG